MIYSILYYLAVNKTTRKISMNWSGVISYLCVLIYVYIYIYTHTHIFHIYTHSDIYIVHA